MPDHHRFSFGKYRQLIIAIALFVVLDLGVLAFNFHAAAQLQEDARLINIAGSLREHSQQITKALLTLERETRDGDSVQTSMAQLQAARPAFNDALARLQQHLAEHTAENAVELADETAQDSLTTRIRAVWQPIDRELASVLATPLPTIEDIESATIKATGRNVRLMQLANDLTLVLEQAAAGRAAQMKQIQMLAVGLAMLNFVLIIFKFIGSLNASDRRTARAREETGRILGAVHEGLFLLTRDGRVGEQRSASLARLFGQDVPAGTRFDEVLAAITSAENVAIATDYIDLLFKPKMKQDLLEQLNPLHEVALSTATRQRKAPTHLRLAFDQVREGEEVVALLVSVFDISQQIRLTQALAGAEARADGEIQRLLGILDSNPHEIAAFVERSRDALQEINSELQSFRPGHKGQITLIPRIALAIHALKGEAGLLGCGGLAREAHAFEDVLQPLRQGNALSGDDLIPVAVALGRLLDELAQIDQVVDRLCRFADRQQTDSVEENLQRIERHAQDIARDLGKPLRVEIRHAPFKDQPPGLAALLREALPQLVRNAIAHGIEPPAERLDQGKPPAGLLRIELQEDDGLINLSVQDDGCGLAPEKLRQSLVDRGILPAGAAAELTDRQIIATLFQPGVSLLEQAGEHAGRGEGLAVVKSIVSRLGGRLRISTRPRLHTRITLQIKAT